MTDEKTETQPDGKVHHFPDKPADAATAMVQVVERLALNPEVDPAKLEKMMDLQERVLNRNAEQAFSAAMAAAQRQMRRVAADADNPQTRSRYATYAALDRALRPVYTEHGFSLSFDTGEARNPEDIRVQCYVAHIDGHSRTYHLDMPADGKGAKGNAVMTRTHAAGAAMSYGMRYLLKMIFNVAVGEDDDDGNGAAPRITQEQADWLREAIAALGRSEEQFAKGFMAESLEDIAASQWGKAKRIIENKKREAGDA